MSRRRRLANRAETRTPAEVDRDVHDELNHHLELLRNDERARAGPAATEESIARTVGARFGDERRYADACRRVALQERFMLQRINLVLLVIMGAALVWLARGSSRASQEHTAALRALTARLDTEDPRHPTPPAPTPTAAIGVAPEAPVVYLSGTPRSGAYAASEGELTLRRLLSAAGFSASDWQPRDAAVLVRRTAGGASVVVFSMTFADFTTPAGPDFTLAAGDLVEAP
jgi:hypothetical protein